MLEVKGRDNVNVKTLVAEEEVGTSNDTMETPTILAINQMVVDPNLILMTKGYNVSEREVHFSQN